MTDQIPPDHSPPESLCISLGTKACLVRYIDSPGCPSLPLSIYQRRPTRRPPLRVDVASLDNAASPFALLTDSATRFQLPKISPSDFGPYESVQIDEETSHVEVESEPDSEPAGDSSVLLSDLLDHLEEAAALSPGHILSSSATSSSDPSGYFSVADTEAETEADSLFKDSGQALSRPEESPPLEGNTPTCSLIESYQELVEEFPVDATSETIATQKDNIDSESVASFVFDAGIEGDLPVTPTKQRQSSTSAPVLSPTFLGPFPTPFSHRQFITPSPSRSPRSPSSSSPREPTSPFSLPRISLRRTSTRPRRNISDVFKQRQASAKH